MNAYQLAQLNIARMLAPLTDPQMAGFVSKLEEINTLADRSAGFVWRLQTSDGDATALRGFEDDRILVNMSVWESAGYLRDYVYRGAHTEVMKRRKDWFERLDGPYLVLWWVRAGHIPTVEEAKERLEHLRRHGPSEHAFTFACLYPAPDEPIRAPQDDFTDPCPAL